MIKRLFLSCLLLTATFSLWAQQKISLQVDAPVIVALDEVFRVEFSINAKPDQFNPPAISGFELLAGPTVSYNESTHISAGNMIRSVVYAYTYVFQPKSIGKFTIPAAGVESDGKTYSSQPITIEVVASGSGTSSATVAGIQKRGNTTSEPPKTSIASDDMLVRVVTNKTSVYKGEPIRVVFRLYTRVPLGGIEGSKAPQFNGFWTQELSANARAQWQRETLNGKVYEATTLREYLLYPQQSGNLQIDPFEIKAVAQIVTQQQSQSEFDLFFGGGPSIQEVRKTLTSPAVKIAVKDFPAGSPAGFNGAVGDFTMSTSINPKSIMTNAASTYTVKISGTGNLPLIQAPKLSLPGSFEPYNIKTTESFNSSSTGLMGYRQFEYPFIARAEGECTIDPVEFSYFNPAQGKYFTINSKALSMSVLADTTSGNVSGSAISGGIVSGLTKEDIRILGQDIRFIKIGSADLQDSNFIFLCSLSYLLIIIALSLFFSITLIYMRKVLTERRNTAFVKGKRANKMALSRFKAAEKYMKDNHNTLFYEEMLRALWGYVSDKLNIPASNLTKDNVREKLLQRGATQENSERFINVISLCEYAQYSPETSQRMNDTYREGVATVSTLESFIGR